MSIKASRFIDFKHNNPIDADPRVLLTFPGCGGNVSYYFGVMHVISKKVDMDRLAFLTRSASAYPVAAAVSGTNVKDAYNLWTCRIRSYFDRTKAVTLRGMFKAIKYITLSAIKDKPPTNHHIEVLDRGFKRRWISEWSTVDEYVNECEGSCHIPFLFKGSYSNRGRIDGAMHIPFWTRMFPAKDQVMYQHQIAVKCENPSKLGFVLGIISPDYYVGRSDEAFNRGVIYANTVLRDALADCGVNFNEQVNKRTRITEEFDHSMWHPEEEVYIYGETPTTFEGPWWVRKLKVFFRGT